MTSTEQTLTDALQIASVYFVLDVTDIDSESRPHISIVSPSLVQDAHYLLESHPIISNTYISIAIASNLLSFITGKPETAIAQIILTQTDLSLYRVSPDVTEVNYKYGSSIGLIMKNSQKHRWMQHPAWLIQMYQSGVIATPMNSVIEEFKTSKAVTKVKDMPNISHMFNF